MLKLVYNWSCDFCGLVVKNEGYLPTKWFFKNGGKDKAGNSFDYHCCKQCYDKLNKKQQRSWYDNCLPF